MIIRIMWNGYTSPVYAHITSIVPYPLIIDVCDSDGYKKGEVVLIPDHKCYDDQGFLGTWDVDTREGDFLI